MALKEEVLTELYKIFDQNDKIEFIDEIGDGRHFALKIISDHFTDITRVQRSRLVYSVLNDFIGQDRIHALKLQLKTPHELQGTNK